MSNDSDRLGPDVYSAMQSDSPYKSYVKTILGMVHVKLLNPFSGKEDFLILKGDPRRNSEGCVVNLWSEKEFQYFKTYNPLHLAKGILIEHQPKEVAPTEEEIHNSMSEEGLRDLVNSPFLKLQHALNKFTSEAPVYRMLTLSEEEEKSEKIARAIKARLSELQEIDIPDAS